MISLIRRHCTTCLDFLYPRICLCCQLRLGDGYHILCQGCLWLFEWSDPIEHCPGCYSLFDDPMYPRCVHCLISPTVFNRLMGCCIRSEASQVLFRRLRSPATSFLAKGVAALMVYHYLHHHMPWPDLIVPMTASDSWQKDDSIDAVCREIARIMSVPYLSCCLQRHFFYSDHLYLKKASRLHDKKILCVGEFLNSTFFQACEVLAEGYPSHIYGLTFSYHPTHGE